MPDKPKEGELTGVDAVLQVIEKIRDDPGTEQSYAAILVLVAQLGRSLQAELAGLERRIRRLESEQGLTRNEIYTKRQSESVHVPRLDVNPKSHTYDNAPRQ